MRALSLSCFVVCFLAIPAVAGPILVQDGKATAVILVAKAALTAQADPPPDVFYMPRPADGKIAAAAWDLQDYLAKITGAKLPIVGDDKEPAGPVVLVGKSALTASWNDRIPTGLTPARDEEGLLILAKGDRLLLAGNDDEIYHGTEYAVAEFLHGLGVRWYLPGPFGEIVPTIKTIAVADQEVRQKPSFKMRNWWGNQPAEDARMEYRWKIRNKMNPIIHFVGLPQDGSVAGYLPPDTIKIAPEALAIGPDGKRVPTMPNLTHPKGVEVVANAIKERLRKVPAATSVGLAPDDGLPRDYDPATLKRNLGFPDLVGRSGVASELSCSEEWIDFVNRVAREVKKEFPNHIFTTNGYANRNTPPIDIEMDKNIWVMFAAIWSDTMHAYDDPKHWQTFRQGQMIKRWAELCPNVFMYDYTYLMLASAGTPVPLARKVRRDYPLLKKWGVIGFSCEGRCVLAESGILPRYLRARMMWDAGLDADKLFDEFFTTWYGAAAKPGRAFWDALEKAIEETRMVGHEDRVLPYVYTPVLLKELEGHAAEAEKLASAEPHKSRVCADRLILEHLKGYMAMTEAEWAADFPAAVKAADTMLAQRKQLHAISSFFFLPDDATKASGFYYWGLVARKKYYQKLADQTTGTTGDMVARLPRETSFRTDPRDEGRFAGWYAPTFADKDWKTIKTTEPYYTQGYLDEASYPTFMGALWYRFHVDVPAAAKSKKVRLYVPTVETEAHVWVNGKFVGHRPYRESYERPNDIDLDVADVLEAGKTNQVTMRVYTGLNAAGSPSGLISRAYLYAPK